MRDEDKTNTIFDEWDYKQLKAECVERKIYVKDMKKVEMARALAGNERDKRRREQEAIIERANKQQQLAKEKQKEDDRKLKEAAAKTKRRLEKQARRTRDESVSEDTPDEEELKMMHNELMGFDADDAGQAQLGHALSEESWVSTSTESSFCLIDPPILPDCRLRLFEWPYPSMPSPVAPPSPFSPVLTPGGSTLLAPILRMPRKISYIPLKVHTTESEEKLFLPGQTYPPGVDPDFVPVLSPRTRSATRNGHLTGILRKATIQPATAWADRTQIQGWNAQMFFSLPSRNDSKMLPDVYNKWYLENRKLLRVKPTDSKADRERRHEQRAKNKKRKLADVLDASEWRPLAMCYLPAYLDHGESSGEEEKSLENLWYVRFPGCDVPHYYFWTKNGEWENPAVPNPTWNVRQVQQNQLTDDEDDDEEHVTLKDGTRVSQKRLPQPPKPLPKTLIRVQSSSVSSTPPSPASSPTLACVVSHIEHQLHTTGLAATLSFYRTKWSSNGKASAWKSFARKLPLLYPSGQFPAVPPVSPSSSISVAMKIASLEMLGDRTLLPPFTGDEAWTSDDDARWDVVEIDVDNDSDQGEGRGSAHRDELEALYRRGSEQLSPRLSTAMCAAWLETVSPSFAPHTPSTVPPSPEIEIDANIREEWEQQFLQPSSVGLDLTCPFCLSPLGSMSFEAQAAHMYAHSAIAPSRRRTSSLELPRVALPPAARQLGRLVLSRKQSIYDIGAEGDSEKTLLTRMHRKKSSLYIKTSTTDKGRALQRTCKPPATPSSHMPSPFLPNFKLCPAGHPNEAWVHRKASLSSADSSEFLDTEGKVRKRLKESVCGEGGEGSGTTPVKSYALDRRSSKTAEPMYLALPPLSSRFDMVRSKKMKGYMGITHPGPSTATTRSTSVFPARKTAKKRKRLADPTYRDRPVSDDEDLTTSPKPPAYIESARKITKRRKKLSDPTYRDYFSSTAGSETDEAAPPRSLVNTATKAKTPQTKRKRVLDPSYRHRLDLSSDSEKDIYPPRRKKLKRKQATNTTSIPRQQGRDVDAERGGHPGSRSSKAIQGSRVESAKSGIAFQAATAAINNAAGGKKRSTNEHDASDVASGPERCVQRLKPTNSGGSGVQEEARERRGWCSVM